MTEMTESDYQTTLETERYLYSWCLQKYGNIAKDTADKLATEFYVYEPPNTPLRGFVFHEYSWNWAMQKIFGYGYWLQHPEYKYPAKEYWREDNLLSAKRIGLTNR